jgi:hypothetical protein
MHHIYLSHTLEHTHPTIARLRKISMVVPFMPFDIKFMSCIKEEFV